MSEQVLVPVRKRLAGSVSDGYGWPEDGAVVMVPYDLALRLASIRDGGFSIVEPAEAEGEEDGGEITEPAPPVKAAVTEPAPRRRARPPANGRASR